MQQNGSSRRRRRLVALRLIVSGQDPAAVLKCLAPLLGCAAGPCSAGSGSSFFFIGPPLNLRAVWQPHSRTHNRRQLQDATAKGGSGFHADSICTQTNFFAA